MNPGIARLIPRFFGLLDETLNRGVGWTLNPIHSLTQPMNVFQYFTKKTEPVFNRKPSIVTIPQIGDSPDSRSYRKFSYPTLVDIPNIIFAHYWLSF